MERHYRGTPFSAADRTGGRYLLTPLYRGEADADGLPPRTYADADCVGFQTADGRPVIRTGEGRYRLTAGKTGGGTELFADAPADDAGSAGAAANEYA